MDANRSPSAQSNLHIAFCTLQFAIVSFLLLGFAGSTRADVVIVESRAGGQNVAAYSEDGIGFPNGWQSSTAKSTAPGVTAGIGSRFNTNAAIGGSATWFAVSPTLALMGGIYRVDVTTTSASGTLTG